MTKVFSASNRFCPITVVYLEDGYLKVQCWINSYRNINKCTFAGTYKRI